MFRSPDEQSNNPGQSFQFLIISDIAKLGWPSSVCFPLEEDFLLRQSAQLPYVIMFL